MPMFSCEHGIFVLDCDECMAEIRKEDAAAAERQEDAYRWSKRIKWTRTEDEYETALAEVVRRAGEHKATDVEEPGG